MNGDALKTLQFYGLPFALEEAASTIVYKERARRGLQAKGLRRTKNEGRRGYG